MKVKIDCFVSVYYDTETNEFISVVNYTDLGKNVESVIICKGGVVE